MTEQKKEKNKDEGQQQYKDGQYDFREGLIGQGVFFIFKRQRGAGTAGRARGMTIIPWQEVSVSPEPG